MAVQLSRRAMISVVGGAAGVLALAQGAAAQDASPTAQPGPEVPEDPTRVQGAPPSPLGSRSPFESPRRLVTGPTSSRTPLDALDGIITPADLHYERHHAGVPLIDPARHTLIVHGLVERPTVFSLADLQRFPSTSRIMFLECSGNTAWSQGPENATAQSLHGLTSTSDWSGVLVKTILDAVGVKSGAAWALAEGSDAAVMTRSVPLEKLLDDAMIAWGQNGEALRPEQGYPMRLLLPGWEGNINIKWLRRLELGDQPYMTREETSKYTDPMPDGTERQFTFVMEAKSTITWPTPAIGSLAARGPMEIKGIAWSGRGKITRVEVSTDGGQTWSDARLEEPVLAIAHTRFRLPWTWNGEEAIIQSRAYDESGYVQPSRAELVGARGTGSIYHYNGIQSWKIAADGKVSNVYV